MAKSEPTTMFVRRSLPGYRTREQNVLIGVRRQRWRHRHHRSTTPMRLQHRHITSISREVEADPRKFQHHFHHQKKRDLPQKIPQPKYWISFNHHRSFNRKIQHDLKNCYYFVIWGGVTEAANLTSMLQPRNLTIGGTLRETWCSTSLDLYSASE